MESCTAAPPENTREYPGDNAECSIRGSAAKARKVSINAPIVTDRTVTGKKTALETDRGAEMPKSARIV